MSASLEMVDVNNYVQIYKDPTCVRVNVVLSYLMMEAFVETLMSVFWKLVNAAISVSMLLVLIGVPALEAIY